MGQYIKVGTITATHGIKGEVKVYGDNPCFNSSFKDALYIDEKLMVEVHIKSVKTQNGKLIVSFKEFNDINQVEKYKNCGIFADRDTLEPLDEDEVYRYLIARQQKCPFYRQGDDYTLARKQ